MKCESDHPEYLETKAEVSEIEGFFCQIRFTGSSQGNYRDINRKARITVSVASTSKQGHREYQQEVLTFEVKLVSGVYVEDRFKRGV